MVEFAAALDRAGWCYSLPSGLYFDTSRDDDYGKLARLDVEGQLEGARVEAVEGKRNPSDFAVWRTAGPGEQRQMELGLALGSGCAGLAPRVLGDVDRAPRAPFRHPHWRR